MGACGYVPPDVRLKQEIIDLVIELEAMGKEPDFCRLVLEEDILNFYTLEKSEKNETPSEK
ncbi:MAG: hypothetical protein PF439_07630 [Helicobacteraceae bacterium]|jgi:hypothetical protein|nr:hypothetical protein [Helicobacteraceae bacterium]